MLLIFILKNKSGLITYKLIFISEGNTIKGVSNSNGEVYEVVVKSNIIGKTNMKTF